MIDETNSSSHDDTELLNAVKAAFGDDAVKLLSDPTPSLYDEALQPFQIEDSEESTAPTTADDGPDCRPARNEGEQVEKYLLAIVGDLSLAIPMRNVHEVQRASKIAFLPGVPPWVLGVTNLRGNVWSVVELRELLGCSLAEALAPRKLVMIQSHVDDVATAIAVDEVRGVYKLAREQVLQSSGTIQEDFARFVSGIVEVQDRLHAVLNVEELLSSDEFRQFDAA